MFDFSCCPPFDATDLAVPLIDVTWLKNKTLEIAPHASSERCHLFRAKLEWDSVSTLQVPRRYAVAVASDKGIYLVGGQNDESQLKSIEYYSFEDSGKDEWTVLTELKHPTSGAAAVILGNTIHVLGGYRESRPQNLVFTYNTSTKEWHEMPCFQTKRGGCAAAVVQDRVHVIGGYDGSLHLSSIEVFENNHWTMLPSRMKGRRSNCGAAVVGSTLYVAGGEDERGVLNSVERYQEGQWIQLPPMRTPRKSFAFAAIHQYLIAAGGNDGSKELDSCELFNTMTQEWTALPSLPAPRGHVCAATSDSSIYIIGGWDGRQCLKAVEKLDILHRFPSPPIVPEDLELSENTDVVQLVELISQTEAAVVAFDNSVKQATDLVLSDFSSREEKVKKEIEALQNELKHAEADRDLFLNELRMQADQWFHVQRKRISDSKIKLREVRPSVKIHPSNDIGPTVLMSPGSLVTTKTRNLENVTSDETSTATGDLPVQETTKRLIYVKSNGTRSTPVLFKYLKPIGAPYVELESREDCETQRTPVVKFKT
jgi:Kelch motif